MTGQIEILAPELALDGSDEASLTALGGPEGGGEVKAMIGRFAQAAKPKAIFGVFPVESRDDGGVTINGVRIESSLMSSNLAGVGRVFPYIITCGAEVEALASGLSDPLEAFWADEIMKRWLYRMYSFYIDDVKRRYDIRNRLAAMNPGSIKEWPLSGQRQLFDIFGGREAVEAAVGVRLTASMLMLPSKSVSGIGFSTDTVYENCSRCPIITCPNRRAEFNPDLF